MILVSATVQGEGVRWHNVVGYVIFDVAEEGLAAI